MKAERDIQIIMAYGEDTSAAEVAEKLGVDRATVYRTWEKARKQGCFTRVVDIAGFLDITENMLLARQLHTVFPQLQKVNVVDVPQDFAGMHGYSPDEDELLQRFLGRVAAENFMFLRSGDRIGLGGGIGPAAMVEFYQTVRLRSISGISIFSLAGTQNNFEYKFGLTSADAITLAFHHSLSRMGVEAQTHIMSLPAQLSSPWRDPTHRDQGEILAKALGGSIAFINNCIREDVDRPLDIAIFTVDNFQGAEDSDPKGICLNQLYGAESQTNYSAVGLPLEILKKVPVRFAIAGGVHRVPQIRLAIAEGMINYLITDNITASSLVS